ncbi:MAG: hypothetical protein QF632_06365 [Candidatus Woesearchaeota archaeon]|jgi:acetoin utilization deacetylase AcuC-like enzyme|nr:hypothetical protein [Candidatus Woesearchaeota archaeon]MDP7324358.1 hypothetical protein [Candidatus Woesearchaeota archaeon]
MKVIYHPDFEDLEGHFPDKEIIEHPSRFDGLGDALRGMVNEDDLIQAEITEVALAALRDTHDSRYIEQVREVCEGLKPGENEFLDGLETYVGPRSFNIAKRAVGAAVQAAQYAERGINAFAVVRPPGHHAARNQAGGHCIFNNIAVAATYLVEHESANRVLMLDIDVHEGNGTLDILQQARFDETVRYLSLSQGGLFGQSLDTPDSHHSLIYLDEGCGDDEYVAQFDKAFNRAIDEFHPNLIAVSAGFDTSSIDAQEERLSVGLQLTRRSYDHVVKKLNHSNLPYFCVLEGGYRTESIIMGLESFITDNGA